MIRWRRPQDHSQSRLCAPVTRLLIRVGRFMKAVIAISQHWGEWLSVQCTLTGKKQKKKTKKLQA